MKILAFKDMGLGLESALSTLLGTETGSPAVCTAKTFTKELIKSISVRGYSIAKAIDISGVGSHANKFINCARNMARCSKLSGILKMAIGTLSSLLGTVPKLKLKSLVAVLLRGTLPINDLVPANCGGMGVGGYRMRGLTKAVKTTNGSCTNNFMKRRMKAEVFSYSIGGDDCSMATGRCNKKFTKVDESTRVQNLLDSMNIRLVQMVRPRDVLLGYGLAKYGISMSNSGCRNNVMKTRAGDCTIGYKTDKDVTIGTDKDCTNNIDNVSAIK